MADDVHNDPSDTKSRGYTRRHRREAAHPREEHAAVYSDTEPAVPAAVRRISWGAIFAGAVIILTTLVVLNLLGISIGFSSIDPIVEVNPLDGLAIGTGIWLLVATVIAYFLGGCVASRLAGIPRRTDGILHGILAWGLVSLVTLYFMTTAVGSVFNSAVGVLGEGLQLASQGVAAAAPAAGQLVEEDVGPEGVSLDALVSDLVDQLQQSVTGPPGTEAGDEAALRQAINALFTPGSDATDRQTLVNLLAARTGMTEAEARQRVQQIAQLVPPAEQVGEEIQQIGGEVAAAISSAALWAFIASIIGVVAAAAGGAAGMPKDLPASPAIRRE